MSKATESTAWEIAFAPEAAGTKTITLSTTNTFVNKDVEITVTTAAGALGSGTGSAEAVSDVGILGNAQASQPLSGHYIKVSADADVAVTTSGWVNSGVDVNVPISDVYYPITEGVITSNTSIEGISTYFNTGSSSSYDVAVTPQHSVTTAGYVAATVNPVDGTSAYYSIKTTSVTEGTTTVSGNTATRGNASWGTGWITADNMGAAVFANTATSGKSYVDISGTSDAPVLISGDYLYINKGYVDDLKISLAKLVPDGSDVKGHSDYILTGHSAYDDDGILIAGSMPIWDGSYIVA